MGNLQIRQVRYSANYLADHWCEKGHIVHILSGEIFMEHQEAETKILQKGMTYLVGDKRMAHRLKTFGEACVFIVDSV